MYCSVGHGQKKHCNHCSSTHRLLGQLIITSTSAVYNSQKTSAYIFLLLQKHTAPAVPNCDQPSGCWQHPSTYHRTGCDSHTTEQVHGQPKNMEACTTMRLCFKSSPPHSLAAAAHIYQQLEHDDSAEMSIAVLVHSLPFHPLEYCNTAQYLSEF